MQRTLRPDQARAIEDLRLKVFSLVTQHKANPDDYRCSPRVMVQAPTGYGKTVVAGAIVERALQRGNHVLFTVPHISLVDQTVASFAAEGITDVGVIQGQHEMTDWRQPVQIATVQTLMRRMLPEADLVLVDEAHKWFKWYGKWFFGFPETDPETGDMKITQPRWRAIPIIGLSATPWAVGLGAYYNDLIIAGTTKELIADGRLSPYEAYAPDHPDLSGVRTVAGDYQKGDLSRAMGRKALVANIVETWQKHGQNRPTFLFAVDRPHARLLQEQFQAAGISAAYIDKDTKREERAEIRRKFHSGDYKIVCNVGVLTVGIDWDVRCIIMARPTKSEMLWVQMIGRGLRTAEGKDFCLILDHSDNHARLGYVDDIHHAELDDGKPKEKGEAEEKKIPLPKPCPQCNFLKPPKTPKCPKCGFLAQAVSTTEVQEGELKRLEPKKRETMANKISKEDAIAELRGFAKEKGYERAEGWAAHKFRELFGVWPNFYKNVPPKPPSILMRSWIKHKQIQHAYSKQKRAEARP